MEDSPLTLAHQHAVQASNILSSLSPPHSPATLSAAASSHALAATSFASAAKTTRDPEAHRTLGLLVAEHERWAIRLRRQAELPVEQDTGALNRSPEPVTEEGSEGNSSGETDEGPSSSRRDRESQKDAPTLPSYPFANTTGTPHYPARLQKSTSSLATNLASARGIPQIRSGTVATVSTTSRRRRSGTPVFSVNVDQPSSPKPTTNPLSLIPPDQPLEASTAISQDASFARFYSSLNYLITKIGSPFTASLAFTGLPVGTDAQDNEIPGDVLPRGWTQGRGRGRNLGLQNDTAGGESFYVVPYSGGTMTYAGVVRRENGGSPDGADIDSVSDGRTVRRSRAYPSPSGHQTIAPPKGSERDDELARFAGHDKTFEELQLENSTLRRTLEQLSRNMSQWQKKTRESEKELKSSIMALSKNNGGFNDILSQAQRRSWLHVPNDDEDDDTYSEGRRIGELELIKEEEQEKAREMGERVKLLEEELHDRTAEMDRMGRENEKLRRTVQKFKERWDALREGARKRERGGGGGGGAVTQLGKVEEGAE